MFALDTNTVIHALKGKGAVLDAMRGRRPAELAIPAIVAYELEVGSMRSSHPKARRRDLQILLAAVRLLPFDGLAAERAAAIRIDLERIGKVIGPMDVLIAGTALAHGATLVTHNTAEFSRIEGLRVVDWY